MADKLNMKKIIAILEARLGELDKLKDFVSIINQQGLTFTRPMEIEELEKVNILGLLDAIPEVVNSTAVEQKLRQQLDLAPAMVVDTVDFI